MKEKTVTIAGAGFSGLTTAFYLVRAGFRVRIVEARPMAGGLLQTVEDEFARTETAANGILNSAHVEDLFRTIGLPIQPTLKESKKRFIFRDGVPRRWPFSIAGSFRILFFLFHYFLAKQSLAPREGESVQTWGHRVLGREVTTYGLEAALQGIYAGDPVRMSASLIFRRMFAAGEKKRARPSIRGTVSAPNGMGELIAALRTYLEQKGVQFDFEHRLALESPLREPLVVATSARAAAELLAPIDPERARAISSVELLPIISTTVVFDTPTKRAQGFGCLFPPAENKPMLGVLMNNFIFPGRGKKGFSETWIMGGASQRAAEVLSKNDQEILNVIEKQRGECFLSVSERLSARVTRWPAALPHYTVDLEKALPIIRQNRQNVFLIGNYTGEIGLSRILEAAEKTAQQISAEGEWS